MREIIKEKIKTINTKENIELVKKTGKGIAVVMVGIAAQAAMQYYLPPVVGNIGKRLFIKTGQIAISTVVGNKVVDELTKVVGLKDEV